MAVKPAIYLFQEEKYSNKEMFVKQAIYLSKRKRIIIEKQQSKNWQHRSSFLPGGTPIEESSATQF
eukprot:scaffold915_cov65-Cylindrotheca_fusiformis.AAC.2